MGKKCIIFEVEGIKQRGRPRKTWKKVVNKDMTDLVLKPDDVMDRRRWKAKIKGYWCDSN